MKTTLFASLAASTFFGLASAHTRVIDLWVDGVDQGAGAGVYIRQPPSNSPVKDLTSTDIRCNVGGTTAVPSTVEVAAGGLIQPEWFHDNRGDDIIDGSHVGPIVAYLAPLESNGEGDVWVKIAEDGYDGSKWAVTKLIANKGKHDVTIPSTLAAGDYLMRVEILALHESDTLYSANSARGIQLYPSCSQITVTGSGSASLPAGVAFPGAYTDDLPGIHFNVYGDDPKTYVIPGPDVWDGASGGPAPTTAVPSSTAVPTTAAPSSVVVPTSAAPSSVVVPTTSAAPSSVVVPSSAPSSVVIPSSAPSSVVVVPSSVVSSTAVPTATVVPPTPTKVSSTAQPTATGTTCTKDAYNCCWDAYNSCVAQMHIAASRGGSVDFSSCESQRNTCTSSITRRHARDLFRLH